MSDRSLASKLDPAAVDPRGATVPAPDSAKVSGRILRRHVFGIASLGTAQALSLFLPFLARERFGASNWQTTVLTAAVPTTQLFTIFWNHFYARVRIRTYLLVVAALACVPIALMALATKIGLLMACFVLAAFGGAGGAAAFAPLNADMLRTCYDARDRGRIFGILSAAQMLAIMIAGQLMGLWSDHNPNAFRLFLPLVAVCMTAGLISYGRICREPLFRARHRPVIEPGGSWNAPLRHMAAMLRADPRFAAYETAFMSYGFGWMICANLLPALGTDRLHLTHSTYALVAVTLFQLTSIAMLAPVGRVADRVGSMWLAAGSFAWLTIYPIGLIFAPNAAWLGFFQVMYALGMVGVQITWTLGPVGLAANPADAPAYLAIHGTLVGVRGVLAQGLGMAIYSWTGRFEIPLAIAAAGFLWASIRMRALARQTDSAVSVTASAPPDHF